MSVIIKIHRVFIMDRLSYYIADRPIFGVLFMLAIGLLMVLTLADVARGGQTAFEERAVTTLGVSSKKQNTNAPASSYRSSETTDDDVESESRSQTSSIFDNYNEPLELQGVVMKDAKYSCKADSTLVTIGGMQLEANENHEAAAYRWRMDILSDFDYSTREEWRGQIPAGETPYDVSYANTSTQALYSRAFTHPHNEIKMRIRTTRPNEVVSDWYVIPASDSCY